MSKETSWKFDKHIARLARKIQDFIQSKISLMIPVASCACRRGIRGLEILKSPSSSLKKSSRSQIFPSFSYQKCSLYGTDFPPPLNPLKHHNKARWKSLENVKMNWSAINSFIIIVCHQKGKKNRFGGAESSFFSSLEESHWSFICLEWWQEKIQTDYVRIHATRLISLVGCFGLSCISYCLLYDYYSSKHFALILARFFFEARLAGIHLTGILSFFALIYCHFKRHTSHRRRQ